MKIDKAKIKILYKKGLSHKEMALETGAAVGTVNQYIIAMKKSGELKKRRKSLVQQGSRHNMSKLSEADIIHIHIMRVNGLKYNEIAEKFNIHPAHVGDIIRGESWRYIFEKFNGNILNSKKWIK